MSGNWTARNYRQRIAAQNLDDAIDRGFDPGEDHGSQPVAAPDAPLSPRLVRWVHQGSPDGCQDCGRRCDLCEDRTCAKWGPAPEPTCGAHFVCEDCAADNHCRECAVVRAEEKEAS